jgi:hypothetical protein
MRSSSSDGVVEDPDAIATLGLELGVMRDKEA